MNAKTKKVLNEQGTQVVQALKWIGGALFGDADEVLDEIAARGDEPQRPPTARPRTAAPAPSVHRPPRATTPRPTVPARDVIDVEGFPVDEDDE
jgi:hypothetical protein